ncbi:hypothetical protein [Aequorivita lipolytica]|nr:hypothetical protein [Aequorivita lipolytica]
MKVFKCLHPQDEGEVEVEVETEVEKAIFEEHALQTHTSLGL